MREQNEDTHTYWTLKICQTLAGRHEDENIPPPATPSCMLFWSFGSRECICEKLAPKHSSLIYLLLIQ